MTPPTITVLLDEQPHPLPAGCTLEQLLQRLGRAPESVATALNGHFVAREARPDTRLAEADRVLLFKPIVGG